MIHYKLLAVLVTFCAIHDTYGFAHNGIGGVGNTGGVGGPVCGNGVQQKCCDQVVKKKDIDPVQQLIYGLINGDFEDALSGIGFNCIAVPVGVAGGAVAKNGCTTQNACCSPATQNGGVINIGCIPINVGL